MLIYLFICEHLLSLTAFKLQPQFLSNMLCLEISSSLNGAVDKASQMTHLSVHSVRVSTGASTSPACRPFNVMLAIVLAHQWTTAISLAAVFPAFFQSGTQHGVVEIVIGALAHFFRHKGDQDLLQSVRLLPSAFKSSPPTYQALVGEIVQREVERIVSKADKTDAGSQYSLPVKLDQGNVVVHGRGTVLRMGHNFYRVKLLSCALFGFLAMGTQPKK